MSAQKTARYGAWLLQSLLLFSMAASGQNVTPSLYSGMRWRMIGPFRGGRALTAAGVRGQRDVYYFGAVGGGVWKTTNGAQTWAPIFDSQPIASIGSLAVAPSDANILYVGTGEASIRSAISFGNGVYKSTDAGKTWMHVGLDDTRHIGRVLIDPKDANVVFVAALGHAYGPNQERGVFRTTDGGRTWQKVLYKDENTGAIDLAFDPDNSKIVYATLWNAHRPPWSSYPPTQGPGSGLYKSLDGGATWTEIRGNGLPSGDWGRAGIATSRKVVYVLLDTLQNSHSGLFPSDEGGLYRSDDRGATWRRVSKDKRIYSRQWYFGEVTVDPNNPDIVYAPNVSVYKSSDGGKTFTAFKGAPGGDDYHFLWLDPDDASRMIVASDQGTVISVDGGKSWSSWYNQPTAQFYHVATDNQFPYYVYGAQQDSGTAATTSRSDYGSITYRDWYPVGAGESGYIAPDPTDPKTVYGGSTYGRLYRFDKVTGQSQDVSPTPVEEWGAAINARKLRFTWTSPIVFSPHDSKTLYMGAQYVLRSNDRGNSWQQISPDLTGCKTPPAGGESRENKAEPVTAQNAAERCYGVVYTIAPSPVDANVIWAGTDTGRTWLTRDGGKTWNDMSERGLGDWSKLGMIEASHFEAGTAYAAVDRHRLDDYAPAIYRTHDFGKSWKNIASRMAAPAFVRAVREDSKRKGLLYAATEMGVYVSFNDGDSWLPLQLNLPVTPVHDLVVHDDDLVIATHGRSFWILDDVTPLRQVTEVGTSAHYFFAPQTAMRVRSDVGHDTPLPAEEPAGRNPPSGAILDYYLAKPATDVTLEILDGNGKLLRRFSSNDKPVEPDRSIAIPSSWFVPPERLETGAGEHRFVWDLRYPDPPSLRKNYDISAVWRAGVAGLPRGPLALPGSYQVRITIDGKSYSRELTVRLDPRLKVSGAELRKQFELEMQITNAMRQAYATMQQRGQTPADASSESAPPRRDTLAGTLTRLAGLLEVVDTADAAPTRQAEEEWQELRTKLAEQLH